MNCPINEQTADGYVVGRCFTHLHDNCCSRHGDVSLEVKHFQDTGQLTREDNRRYKRWSK